MLDDEPKPGTPHTSILAHALRIFRREAADPGSSSLVVSPEGRGEPTSQQDAIIQERETLDAAVIAYIEWRAACAAVRKAYRAWAYARAADAAIAYFAYRATLDCEQAAAEVYADLMRMVGHLVESGLDSPSRPPSDALSDRPFGPR
jgi:hypothetical protein